MGEPLNDRPVAPDVPAGHAGTVAASTAGGRGAVIQWLALDALSCAHLVFWAAFDRHERSSDPAALLRTRAAWESLGDAAHLIVILAVPAVGTLLLLRAPEPRAPTGLAKTILRVSPWFVTVLWLSAMWMYWFVMTFGEIAHAD